jgi:Family of unknown function (DUF6111)
MIRSLVPSILLFLLPFALYFLWLGLKRRQRPAETEVPVSGKYLAIAGGIGLALAVGGFVIFTDFSGASPDEIYVPPSYQDGKVVPGHFKARESAP